MRYTLEEINEFKKKNLWCSKCQCPCSNSDVSYCLNKCNSFADLQISDMIESKFRDEALRS